MAEVSFLIENVARLFSFFFQFVPGQVREAFSFLIELSHLFNAFFIFRNNKPTIAFIYKAHILNYSNLVKIGIADNDSFWIITLLFQLLDNELSSSEFFVWYKKRNNAFYFCFIIFIQVVTLHFFLVELSSKSNNLRVLSP